MRSGGQTQTQQVMSARSYLSQSDLPVTFGLGAESKVEGIEITWPGGARQEAKDWKTDAMTVIEER